MGLSLLEIGTNRGLLVFSIILILLGFFVSPFLYLIGFFLLFPALLLPSNPKPTGTPPVSQQKPSPRRVSAPSPPVSREPVQESATAKVPESLMRQSSVPQVPQIAMPLPNQGGQQSFQPLFGQPLLPSNLSPSFSQYPLPSQPEKITQHDSYTSGDELIELGALLALLKLAFG